VFVFVCQWHLDIPFGKQGDVVRIMTAWGKEKVASSEFKRCKGTRLMVGHIGDSASHIVDEYLFETLADLEAALGGMTQPQFRPHAEALAPFIVPGSQRWVVYRVLS
jgi:hypothetical protein